MGGGGGLKDRERDLLLPPVCGFFREVNTEGLNQKPDLTERFARNVL